jgi:uncharacterized repeat protein (TIGR03803 family)
MIQMLIQCFKPRRIEMILALILIIRLLPDSYAAESPYTSLYKFNGINDNCPYPQTKGNNNKLYGPVINFDAVGIPRAWKIAELDVSSATPRCRVLFESPINTNEGAITKMLYGKDGKLYGIHSNGGDREFGSIFVLDINQTPAKYTVLYDFDDIHGNNPLTLIQGKNGKLYGTTANGGTFNRGTIFQLDINSSPQLEVLHEFQGNYTPLPNALIQSNNGRFYGTTFYAGDFGNGSIFQLDLSGSIPQFSTIHSFKEYFGVHPAGSLVLARDGSIYGVTEYTDGYANRGYGTLYKIDLTSTPTHKLIYNIPTFSAANHPTQIIQGPENKLYGLFGSGYNGWIAQFDQLNTTPKLGHLRYYMEYGYPSPLFYASDGYLYGSFAEGGTLGHGELFRLSGNLPSVSLTSNPNPVSSGQEVMLSAKLSNGANPRGLVSFFETSYDCQFLTSYLLTSSNNERLLGSMALSADSAIFKTRFPSGGIHYLIARYEGDALNNLNVSNCLKLKATTPDAIDDLYTLSHVGVQPVTVAKPGVLVNDSDPEGSPLSVVGATASSPKTIFLTNSAGVISGGKISLYEDGHFVYEPSRADFVGTRNFTYQATDVFGNSNPARVTLKIRRSPSAVNDVVTTAQGQEKNLNVTANDVAYDGAVLNPSSVKIEIQPRNGKVINNANGKITYIPNKGFGGTDTFAYTVRDNSNAISNRAVVSIHIPVAIADNYRVIANTNATQQVSFSAVTGVGANDLPIGLSLRTFSRVGGISRVAGMGTATPGWLNINTNGAFMFVLSAPLNANTPALIQKSKLGTYQFKYTETLNGITSPVATVTVNVQ